MLISVFQVESIIHNREFLSFPQLKISSDNIFQLMSFNYEILFVCDAGNPMTMHANSVFVLNGKRATYINKMSMYSKRERRQVGKFR